MIVNTFIPWQGLLQLAIGPYAWCKMLYTMLNYANLLLVWYTTIVSLTNSFAATAGTNTRNATFKIVHSDLLNIT